MKKGWNITEKIIATILQGWALFYLYFLTMGIKDKVDFGLQTNQIKKEDVTFWELFKIHHFDYLAGVLCFVAGLALLYDKKTGWITSVISTAVFAGFMLVSGQAGIKQQNNPHIMVAVSYLIAAAVFAAMFLLLLLKPFRLKYKPNVANWLVILLVLVLAVMDKTVF